MDNYVPFLKLKSNEIMALKVLEPNIKNKVTPFFDIAKKDDLNEDGFVDTIIKLEKSISRNIPDINSFYIDNFDIPSGFLVSGENNYRFVLDVFSAHNFIPVISIDRNNAHIVAVYDAKVSGALSSDVLAVRMAYPDFELYGAIREEIIGVLDSTIHEFSEVDLILDCRYCASLNPDLIGPKIVDFIDSFVAEYAIRKVILTGSTIPPSVGDMLDVNSHGEFVRNELAIFREVAVSSSEAERLYLGDYCVVSPNYSDATIPGYALLNVMTPKIVYSFDDKHYVIRGGALKTHPLGNAQYNVMSNSIVCNPIYRGIHYSFGDNFLDEKRQYIGSAVMPGTILKPMINAHISYMFKDFI